MKTQHSIWMGVAVAAALSLTACGSDSDSGPRTIEGTVTGFGSLLIDGTEYELQTGAQITSDGVSVADETNYSVGDYVRGKGFKTSNTTGVLSEVHYSDDLQMEVTSVTDDGGIGGAPAKVTEFVAGGYTVKVDASTRFSDETLLGLNTIDDLIGTTGLVVEVSGLPGTMDCTIDAKRVEVKSASVADAVATGDDLEVKGVVANLGVVGPNHFDLMDGATVCVHVIATGADLPTPAIQDGDWVEVKTTSSLAVGPPPVLTATEVENEDIREHDDGDELEREVVVASALVGNEFTARDGLVIRVDAGTEFDSVTRLELENGVIGLTVKVEGRIVDATGDGVLLAHEIERENDGDTEFRAPITAKTVDAGMVTGTVDVLGKTIAVVVGTEREDDRDDIKTFNLGDLVMGDWVKVSFYTDTNGNRVADELKRTDLRAAVKLEGLLEVSADTIPVYSIDGITVDITGVSIGAAVAGDEVEFEGSYDMDTDTLTATSFSLDS